MKYKTGWLFAAILFSFTNLAVADDWEGPSEAEIKAKTEFDRATSDIAYYNDIFKALYFQNMEMISLLKDVRQQMKQMSEMNQKFQNSNLKE